MFEFYINNTLVQEPMEWAEFSEILQYDDQVHGILMKYDKKFTFANSGYDVISNAFALNGYCQQLSLLVVYRCSDGSGETLLDGRIFLSEAKFNRSKCTVEVEFEDNSFTAKIFANRGVKAYVNADRSKNGVTITPAPKFALTMFDPAGVIANFQRDAYDLYDCFEYLIAFMTDGTVGFVSNYLSNLDDDKNIAVTSGTLLRLTAPIQYQPNISFIQLFDEVRKKLNIAFAVEKDNANNPVIRIENFDYFKDQQNQSATISNIPELIESLNSDYYFASIEMGGPTAPYKPLQHSLPPIPFITHQDEDFPIQSECNTDETLNLKSEFLIDSNTIQGMITSDTANSDYDKLHAFIQYTKSTTTATKWNTIDNTIYPNKWYYNEIFTNAFVSANFNLQGDIAKYLGAAVATFEATKTLPSATMSYTSSALVTTFTDVFTDVEFANDSVPPGQDPGGNYDNTTYRYTASASGTYTFYQEWYWNIIVSPEYNNGGPGCFRSRYWGYAYVTLRFNKYDAGGSLIQQSSQVILNNPPGIKLKPGLYPFSGTQTLFLNAGEQVSVEIEITAYYTETTTCAGPYIYGVPFSYNIADTGTFKLLTSNTGGGIYGQSKDGNKYYSSEFDFEQVLTEAEWSAIKNNPANFMQFSMTNANYKNGWLKKIERNKASGLTKFTLISNIDNI